MVDAFEARYTAAVLPDPALAAAAAARVHAGAMPSEAWALGGCVLTPHRRLEPGWVVIDGNRIAEVADRAPEGLRSFDTGGVILPGLIDLHGHPEFNVFPAWEPPRQYTERQQWRGSRVYKALIKEPYDRLHAQFESQLARYGEFRALIGGTTAIQGAHWPSAGATTAALVRNVDLAPFGLAAGKAASLVDPLTDPDRFTVKSELEQNSLIAFYAHLAEGTDQASRDELNEFINDGLLTSSTVIIHGTALTVRQLAEVADAGAKLIWSPQSELRLYGATTGAATVRELGMPLALGADWLPSGSVSLLAEIQVARHVLASQDDLIEPRELTIMVTSGAAEIAGLADYIGHLAPGRRADLLVLERLNDDPYETVCQANRGTVELVVIDGNLIYGRHDWFNQLVPDETVVTEDTPDAPGELVWAWGKLMRLQAAPSHHKGSELPPEHDRLQDIRATLLAHDHRLGPIFA